MAMMGLMLMAKYFSKPYTNLLSQNYLNFISRQNGEFDKNARKAVFLNRTLAMPGFDWALEPDSRVLAATDEKAKKRIEISLNKQRLYAYEGDKKVFEFLISSGKWFPTPTGNFRIYSKYRYQTMIGGDQALGTYYNLPNVPYVIYFLGGFALHGTYWHNNFGTPMSHGCINLNTADAKKLYYWTNPASVSSVALAKNFDEGTPIIIKN